MAKLALIPSEDQAPRAALAEAIAEAERVRARRDVVQNAIVRAEAIVAAALLKYEEAQAGVTLAQDAQADRVAASAAEGSTLLADPSLRDARLAEAEALDELQAARLGLQKLRDQIAAKEMAFETVDDLTVALRTVDDRIDDVIRSVSLDEYVAETAAMQDELIKRRLILYYLMHSGLVGEATRDTEALQKLMSFFQLPQYLWPRGPGFLFHSQENEIITAPREWREVRETMKRDAHAPLPW